MPIHYGHDSEGAFIAYDDTTGISAYAFSTSTFAKRAKHRHAGRVALEMLRGEMTGIDRTEFDARNMARIMNIPHCVLEYAKV